ncbi:LPD1 domain-containing protein [Azospirillum canadense]|uniref:LPD1 domain-containing protein n=1 Tax=Azospirillum canadense TaxID=403962 RepID=UPI002226244D|nr:LPD1 domain-containing protein [Azospirillum canadense]MCW2240707.1 hypothetical protein [Azospirillum canadense]
MLAATAPDQSDPVAVAARPLLRRLNRDPSHLLDLLSPPPPEVTALAATVLPGIDPDAALLYTAIAQAYAAGRPSVPFPDLAATVTASLATHDPDWAATHFIAATAAAEQQTRADAHPSASIAAPAGLGNAEPPTPPASPLRFTVIETKHPIRRMDLWVVQPTVRVDSTLFAAMMDNAKSHRGWYSSDKGKGAVPGFQFRSAAAAQAFIATFGHPPASSLKLDPPRRAMRSDSPATEPPASRPPTATLAIPSGAESTADRAAVPSSAPRAEEGHATAQAAAPEQPAPLTPPATRPEPTHPSSPSPSSPMLLDAGTKIGGARKDLWAQRGGLTLSDLDGMTAAEESKFVTKEQVWPRPDYGALIAAGEDPIVVRLKKTLYDGLATKPRHDTPDGRRDYLRMIAAVRAAVDGARSTGDLQGVRTRVQSAVGFNANASIIGRAAPSAAQAEARRVYFSALKSSDKPLFITATEIRKAQQDVASGWPAPEPWQRLFDVHTDHRGGLFVTNKGQRAIVADDFADREAAIAWCTAHAETLAANTAARTDANPTPTTPHRPHLDGILRTGPDRRQGRDITSEDFRTEFGFRGVEFGNWVASDERQKAVNHAFDALHDLADILNVSPKALSLGGSLAVAFGARGNGAFAAHYEPSRRVVNLTKIRGAGALAHEWAHALDHHFGELDNDAANTGASVYVSSRTNDTAYGKATTRIDRTTGKPAVTPWRPNLRPEVAAAWATVLNSLFTRPQTLDEAIARREESIAAMEARVAKYRADIAKVEASAALRVNNATFLRSAKDYIQAAESRELPDLRASLDRLRSGADTTPNRPVATDYATEAGKLSGKSGDYWTRPTEMLARALESYVFDRIQARGDSSPYLVQGVESDRFASPAYKGNPYPTGPERTAINAALDTLFATMRERTNDQGLPTLYDVAYHGSPHDFDRFSLDHLGTGEGVQAFGHGLYFASSQTVAEWYRDRLAGTSWRVGNRVASIGDLPKVVEEELGPEAAAVADHVQYLLTSGYGVDDVLRNAAHRQDGDAIRLVATTIERLGEVDQGKVLVFPGGRMRHTLTTDESLGAAKAGTDIAFHMRTLGVGIDDARHIALEELRQANIHRASYRTRQEDRLARALDGDDEDALFRARMDLHNSEWLDREYMAAEAILASDDTILIDNTQRRGRLYQVDLSPAEDEYLVWDKSLSEQSETVKAALAACPEWTAVPPEWTRDSDPGSILYLRLALHLGGGTVQDHAAASKALHAAGIPGIKYLDGTSRSQGDGSHNYVIFDATLVTITAKHDAIATVTPAPLTPSASSAALPPTPAAPPSAPIPRDLAALDLSSLPTGRQLRIGTLRIARLADDVVAVSDTAPAALERRQDWMAYLQPLSDAITPTAPIGLHDALYIVDPTTSRLTAGLNGALYPAPTTEEGFAIAISLSANHPVPTLLHEQYHYLSATNRLTPEEAHAITSDPAVEPVLRHIDATFPTLPGPTRAEELAAWTFAGSAAVASAVSAHARTTPLAGQRPARPADGPPDPLRPGTDRPNRDDVARAQAPYRISTARLGLSLSTESVFESIVAGAIGRRPAAHRPPPTHRRHLWDGQPIDDTSVAAIEQDVLDRFGRPGFAALSLVLDTDLATARLSLQSSTSPDPRATAALDHLAHHLTTPSASLPRTSREASSPWEDSPPMPTAPSRSATERRAAPRAAGALVDPMPDTLPETAFHGSPHTFDKFSLSAIGSGEGGQLFGHGLYFAGNEAVARHYRQALSGQMMLDGEPLTALASVDDMAAFAILQRVQRGQGFDDAKRNAAAEVRQIVADAIASLATMRDLLGVRQEGWGDLVVTDEELSARERQFAATKADLDARLAAIEAMTADRVSLNAGRLYTVDLTPPEDAYLLHDQPLHAQSRHVRDALIAANLMAAPPELRVVERQRGRGTMTWTDFTPAWVDPATDRVESFYSGFEDRADAEARIDELRAHHPDLRDWSRYRTTGAAFYTDLCRHLGSPEAASTALRAAGIPGIKYLDGTSRANGEGSYNYVLFDDSLVTITAMQEAPAPTPAAPATARLPLTALQLPADLPVGRTADVGTLKLTRVEASVVAVIDTDPAAVARRAAWADRLKPLRDDLAPTAPLLLVDGILTIDPTTQRVLSLWNGALLTAYQTDGTPQHPILVDVNGPHPSATLAHEAFHHNTRTGRITHAEYTALTADPAVAALRAGLDSHPTYGRMSTPARAEEAAAWGFAGSSHVARRIGALPAAADARPDQHAGNAAAGRRPDRPGLPVSVHAEAPYTIDSTSAAFTPATATLFRKLVSGEIGRRLPSADPSWEQDLPAFLTMARPTPAAPLRTTMTAMAEAPLAQPVQPSTPSPSASTRPRAAPAAPAAAPTPSPSPIPDNTLPFPRSEAPVSDTNSKKPSTAAPSQPSLRAVAPTPTTPPTVPPTLAATIEAAVSDPDPVRAGWLAGEAARWAANLMDRAGDALLQPPPPALDTLRQGLADTRTAFHDARNALAATLGTAFLSPDAAAARLRTALSAAGGGAQGDILARLQADPTELGVLRGGKLFGRETRAAALAAIAALPERVRAASATRSAVRDAEAAVEAREAALADPTVAARHAAAATLQDAAQIPAAARLPAAPPPSIAALGLPPTSAATSQTATDARPSDGPRPETLCHRLLWLAAERFDRVAALDWKRHLAAITHPTPGNPPSVPRDAVDAARAWQGRNERRAALDAAVSAAVSAARPGPAWLFTYHRATHLATTLFAVAQTADAASDPLTTTHAHQIATAADAVRPLCAAQTLLAVRNDPELHRGLLATNQYPTLHTVAQNAQPAALEQLGTRPPQSDAADATNDHDLDMGHGMG